MSALAAHLDDYLRLRRGLGFQLGRHGEVLPHFVAYLDARGAATVTVEAAVKWAQLREGIKPITVDFNLSAVRGFAAYLHTLDPAHEIVPAGLLSAGRHRPAPHIYTADQIAALLDMAGRLQPRLRALTLRTLLGLLAATGMRVGEATGLKGGDVDLGEGIITVRAAKFDRVRLVPLHPSVIEKLGDYRSERDQLCRAPSCDRFFLTTKGSPLHRRDIDVVFAAITTAIKLRTDTVHPRVHDLRHTFAVRTLIDAHRKGRDVNAVLPVLSTYLGHVEPANTYWYLEAVPELMHLVAERLERYEAGVS